MMPRQWLALLLGFAGVSVLHAPPAAAQLNCPSGSLPAYAHNDYANDRPLFDALELGFRGVEVDVFLINDTLRVGHDAREASRAPSFEVAYLAPLLAVVERCSGLIGIRPFMLAIEVKQSSPRSYDALLMLLARYAELFSAAVNAPQQAIAPVEVILVGWHPPLAVLADSISSRVPIGVQQRLASERARPDSLDPRVRLLSLDYGKTMGRWWRTDSARSRWLDMLRAARSAAPDRLIRVHNLPPDARLYETLRRAGVDLLGTKQLKETHRLLQHARTP